MDQTGCTGYRFDTFEVHLRTGTLSRRGHTIRIQQLPFQLLVVLLEHAGQPVTPQELRGRLWGDETYLELDNNLRVAAAKLRDALGDPATEPKFIRTISRKGYQFIGDAISLYDSEPASVAAGSALQKLDVDGPVQRSEMRSYLPGHRLSVFMAVLAAVMVAFTVAGAIYWSSHRPLALGDQKVALGSIDNNTGDATFDGTLSTAFRFKVQASPYLNLVQEQDFRRLLKVGNGGLALPNALAVCRSLGAGVFLDGSIGKPSSEYQIVLNAWSCSDGQRLETSSSSASSQANVLPALDQVIEQMRRRLGEPQSSIARNTVPLIQATTSSLLALKSLTLGDEKLRRGDVTQSISDYKLAIDIDPEFALAHARLGMAYMNARQYANAKASVQRAFELRDRTTDRERLYIATQYYSYVSGELPREIEAYRVWQTVYPRDVRPVEGLANVFLVLGDAGNAMELSKKAVQLDPFSPVPYALVARADLGAGKYAELENLCTDPVRRKTDIVLFHSTCYTAAFDRKDKAAEQRELQWAQGNPQESVMLEYVAWGEIYEGRLEAGRRSFELARQSAVKNNLIDFVAELDLDEAGLEADAGLPVKAREHAIAALKIAPKTPLLQALAALVLARSGDVARAEAEASNAAAQAPSNTIQNAALLSSVHAAIQLQKHDAKAAIRSMEDARPFDDISFMALSPAYYRGLALLEDQRFGDAASAFQQVVDHATLYPESLYSELARLQLGRSLQLSGESDAAGKQYQVMDRLWATADDDFPPLKELRAYEKQLR